MEVKDGAKSVRKAVRTLNPAPMRRAVRELASGAEDLTNVDLESVGRECAAAREEVA